MWKDAAHLFSEADNLDKWRDLYGGKIYASLGRYYFLTNNLFILIAYVYA